MAFVKPYYSLTPKGHYEGPITAFNKCHYKGPIVSFVKGCCRGSKDREGLDHGVAFIIQPEAVNKL